jgi:hypothetical protein
MLRLASLRTLDLDHDTSSHLSAASGLVRIGCWCYVVADDELALGVFEYDGTKPGKLLPLFEGELPRGKKARKAVKPDLEVLLRLPPDVDWPHGALLALGSGSRPNRERGVLLLLDADGAISAPPRVIDAASLFSALRAAWPVLNLEGAALQGDTLWFCARASRDEPRNALLGLPYAPLRAGLRDGMLSSPVDPPTLRVLMLACVDGIAFGVTDLVALPDGRFAFCAVTEDSRDSYHDGPCSAAALGVLAADGALERFARVDPPFKIEGLDVRVEPTGLQCWLVSDADDAGQPAHLLSVQLPLG